MEGRAAAEEGSSHLSTHDVLYGTEEQQIQWLNHIFQHPELISANVADYWAALQTLSTNELMSVRSTALLCSAQLIPLCDPTSFSQTFAAQCLVTLTTLLSDVEKVSDARISLSHLEHAKIIFSFFATALTLVPESWRAELLHLRLFFQHIFDALSLVLNNTTKKGKTWIPTLVKAGVPKETVASIHKANTELYNDVLSLISQTTRFLCLAPVALPNADEIAFACRSLMPICEIKGDSRLTGVIWKALKELFETFSPVLQDRQVELVEPIILSILRVMNALLSELLLAAPRAQERDPLPLHQTKKTFNAKLQTLRFFFNMITFYAKDYPYAFPQHLQAIASFVVRTYGSLKSPKPFTAETQALILKHISSGGSALVRRLIGSPLSIQSKLFLLEQFYIEHPNDPLAPPKLHVLLVLVQQIPSESVFPAMSRILYSVVEGLIQCWGDSIEEQSGGISYNGALLASSGFLYHLAACGGLPEVEVFLFEHLFHPHFLASLFAAQLWHFMLSNADDAIRSRHATLVTEMIEKGKQKMRMRLARFLPFILPTLSLADTEVIFNGAMKNFMGVKALSASAPPASSLKMAAPVLPILPLAKLMGQNKAAKQGIQNLIGGCIKACSAHYTPPKSLYWSIECLRGIYSHADLWEGYDLQAQNFTSLLGDTLDKVTKGQMAHKNAILQSLIQFSSVLTPILPHPTISLYLTGFKSLATAFPPTKLAIIAFVHKCVSLEFEQDTQKDILASFSALFQLFFDDRDWIVCAEVIKLIRYCMMYGTLEVERVQKMLTPKDRELMKLYLQEQSPFPPTDKPYMTSEEALNMWSKKLQERVASLRKSVAARASASGQGGGGWRMGEASRLQKMLKLMKMANEIATSIPAASLAHSAWVHPIQHELENLATVLGIQQQLAHPQSHSPTNKTVPDTQNLPNIPTPATTTIDLSDTGESQ